MSTGYQRNDVDSFLTNVVEHEGDPLALRVRPDADTVENRTVFSRLLMISHALAEVRSNGLPESEYNQSLAPFDKDLFEFFEGDGDGIVALVETFAGKRIYYAYVDRAATFKAKFAELTAKYPQHEFDVSYREEDEWETYKLYLKLYPWK